MRYCAVIEYDGTNYYGFQRQREEPTVQGELERAISVISGQEISVIGAGRTDSGVHAVGQVVAFDLDWNHGHDALHRAMNATLAADVSVARLSETREDFHPRFDAKRRAFEYYIYNKPVRSATYRRMSWHISRPLDVEQMNRAGKVIIGSHDFATFGQPPKGQNSVRQVFWAEWYWRGELLVFKIEANAFLYRMVRSLVGSIKAIGDGSWNLEEFVAAFKACDRSRAGQTAPPHGLFLTSVNYE